MYDDVNGLLKLLYNLESFKLLEESIKKYVNSILVSGVIDSQKTHIITSIKQKINKPILIVTYSEIKAKEIVEDMNFFFNMREEILLYPSKDVIFYNADIKSVDIVKQRFKILNSIINNKTCVIVLSIESLFDRLSPYDKFKESILKIGRGKQISLEIFIEKLIFLGYERKELVESPGQFVVRGGILDIYIPTNDNALRLEFYGDEIESIRFLDTRSQRSIESVESIEIFPMRELVYTQKELDMAIKLIQGELEKTLDYYEKKGLTYEYNKLKGNTLEFIEKLKERKTFNGVDRFIQYFYDKEVTLLDYLPRETIIYFDEPAKIKQKADNSYMEFIESINNRISKGYILPSQKEMIFNYTKIIEKSSKFIKILFVALTYSITDFNIKKIIEFKVKGINTFKNRIDLLIKDLIYFRSRKVKVIILAGNKTRALNIVNELLKNELSAKYVDKLCDINPTAETIMVMKGSLNRSFEYSDISLAIISDKEFFNEKIIKSKSTRIKNGNKIQNFTDLYVGDYIVHKNHGIGIYKGLETIVVDNISRDYLKILYSDGGSLYVPTNQMDLVQKYIGGDKVKPKINKLSGSDWIKAKNKTQRAVKILAQNLIKLYGIRQKLQGYCYTKDTVWQKEFEDLFPYTETDDQLKAIEEVKKDMESSKVMDRLICGDVGYGKTEIAIRASFKAVQDTKQVAYLVPTTILAQQHYNTFVRRMKDFPIKIGLLSRFRTQKEQKETILKLLKGEIDIVIGTHRVLSKDVKFKDLGLVIVDEEQRFGVFHKEKLKQLKENVDVLTLTATPIPRTLHMSLIGIRDMSVLEEPPQHRYPIQTYIMEYNEDSIKDAINRELSRGGQVYYLYNRVKNISDVAIQVQNLVPEANVSYIHGQMSENQIETIMLEFVDGSIDILVCTTIIEIGMDISNVNTIIIQNVEMMGLSQLYQLRGRVGRSNRIAYAYLMYTKDKVLDEITEKRLQTIKDFTEFGSGLKIAMRDLEIRGAGNILGLDQHGHINSVGYELYCKLLQDAVSELKGEKNEQSFETTIDIDISAYISSGYIENEEQKLEIYIKISNIKDVDDYYNLQNEIEDRYGKIPNITQNLLDISLLKAIANKVGIDNIFQRGNNIVIKFNKNFNFDPMKITKLVQENSDKFKFKVNEEASIIYKNDDKISNKDIVELRKFLEQL